MANLLNLLSKSSPLLIDLAGKLARKAFDVLDSQPSAPQSKSTDLSSIEERVSRLEKSEVDQAKLIQEMANHLKGLTEVLRVLSIRLNIAILFGLVGIILGAVALWKIIG